MFQSFNLLDHLSVRENVSLPAYFAAQQKAPPSARWRRSSAWGWPTAPARRPGEPVGRAKANAWPSRARCSRGPSCSSPTEPTRQPRLGDRVRQIIGKLFQKLNSEGLTLIVVTHEERVSRAAKRVLRLEDGRLATNENTNGNANPPAAVPRRDRARSCGAGAAEFAAHAARVCAGRCSASPWASRRWRSSWRWASGVRQAVLSKILSRRSDRGRAGRGAGGRIFAGFAFAERAQAARRRRGRVAAARAPRGQGLRIAASSCRFRRARLGWARACSATTSTPSLIADGIDAAAPQGPRRSWRPSRSATKSAPRRACQSDADCGRRRILSRRHRALRAADSGGAVAVHARDLRTAPSRLRNRPAPRRNFFGAASFRGFTFITPSSSAARWWWSPARLQRAAARAAPHDAGGHLSAAGRSWR